MEGASCQQKDGIKPLPSTTQASPPSLGRQRPVHRDAEQGLRVAAYWRPLFSVLSVHWVLT